MISARLNADDIRRFCNVVGETTNYMQKLQNVADAVFNEVSSRLQKEAEAYGKCIKDCKTWHDAATVKIAIIDGKIAAIKLRIGEINVRLATITAELLVLRGERMALLAEAVTSPATAVATAKRIEELKEAIDMLCCERDKLKSELSELRSELDDLYDKKDVLQEARDGLEAELKSVQDSLDRLQSQIDELQACREQLAAILNKLIKRAEIALPDLQKAHRMIQSYLNVRLNGFSANVQERPVTFLSSDEVKKMGMSPAEYKEAQEATVYSPSILKYCRTLQEARYYHSLGLVEGVIGGRPALLNPKLDFATKVPNVFIGTEETNYDIMLRGQSPRLADDNSEYYELHHIGQYPDSPLAELPTYDHRYGGNYDILHTSINEKSKINREAFNEERRQYWIARASTLGGNNG